VRLAVEIRLGVHRRLGGPLAEEVALAVAGPATQGKAPSLIRESKPAESSEQRALVRPALTTCRRGTRADSYAPSRADVWGVERDA
jgi:hypothetical protein